MKGKPLKDTRDDRTLPVCWKGPKTIGDVKDYFKPLQLSFTKAKNVQLELSPEAYLIVTVSTSTDFIMIFIRNILEKKNILNDLLFFRNMEMCAWEF